MRMLGSGPPPHLPGFLNSLAGPLDHFGYWAVLLFVMIEDFGVPVPGETILIGAAVYAGAGRLNVLAVGVIGFVAAVIGDNIGFAIGHYGGRTGVLRWGRYVRLTGERLDKAEISFQRHSAWIITIARFIEVLRQVNGIVAGTTGLRWRRFLAFNALGAALWVGTWVSLGYLAGNQVHRRAGRRGHRGLHPDHLVRHHAVAAPGPRAQRTGPPLNRTHPEPASAGPGLGLAAKPTKLSGRIIPCLVSSSQAPPTGSAAPPPASCWVKAMTLSFTPAPSSGRRRSATSPWLPREPSSVTSAAPPRPGNSPIG